MKKDRIQKLEVLAKTKFLSLYDATHKNKNGKEGHWIIASRKNKEALDEMYFNNGKENIDAVVICALHKELEKLVLIKQFRVPINDYVYEIPAGLIDNNEDMYTSAIRELKEETGLDVIEFNKNLSKEGLYLSAGMTDESVGFVYCYCNGEVSNEYLEDDEDIEVILVSQQEAKHLLESNVKFDIKAYITLQNFLVNGKKILEKI